MIEKPTVIITGASRGLGAEIARAAAKMDANLVLAARSAELLDQLSNEIRHGGGNVVAAAGDISREADCQAIVRQALEGFGRIDALVNNAGRIEPIARIAQADPRDWQLNWKVNVLGPLLLTQLALPELRRSKGRVINVTSGASTSVILGWGAYSTAKAAIDHFTRILAAEEPSITALFVQPGIINTDMQATIRATGRAAMAEEDYNFLAGRYEEGRLVPASVSGQAIAALALRAPHEWSGEMVSWDEERVRELS